MITLDKIKLFNKYDGDLDGLARTNRSNDLKLIEDKEWAEIDGFFQDIELISKGLATTLYTEKALSNLKAHCDKGSFDFFTQKIPFYQDFQDVANILKEIKKKINNSTDIIWVGFDNSEALLFELDHSISRIEICDFQILKKVSLVFAPTGSFQELSISNDWSDDYIKLASDFDELYEKLTKGEVVKNDAIPKNQSWWKKLFGSK